MYDEVLDDILVEWSMEDHSEQMRAHKRAEKRDKRNVSHLLFPVEPVKEEPVEAAASGDNDGAPAGGDPPPKGMKNCRVCTFFIAESAKTCHVCDQPQ